MTTVNVQFDIRSNATMERFTTTGKLEENVLKFQDPSGDKHCLTLEQFTLAYQKTGDTIMDFTFDPAEVTAGTYRTMGQTLQFNIRTTQYVWTPGTIRLHYKLYQDQNRVGDTILAIDYQSNKEE